MPGTNDNNNKNTRKLRNHFVKILFACCKSLTFEHNRLSVKILPDIVSSPRKRRNEKKKKNTTMHRCCDHIACWEFQNGGIMEALRMRGKHLRVLDFCFCILRAALAYNSGLIIYARFSSSLLINIKRLSQCPNGNVKRNAKRPAFIFKITLN